MAEKIKRHWGLALLGLFLVLVSFSVHAFPGESCAPLVGGVCDVGEKCVFEPANGKWWVCEGMNVSDWLNSVLNAMNFGTLVCSSAGFFAGACAVVVVPLLGVVLGALILAFLGFTYFSVPPGPILAGVGVIGAVLGFILASFLAAWWIPILIIVVVLWYLKSKG